MTLSRHVRILVVGLVLGPEAATLPAEAQPARSAIRPGDRKIPRVGVPSTSTQSSPPMAARLDAFRQDLRALGYVED